MGREITTGDFRSGDYRHFCRKLRQNLKALSAVLQRPDFGRCTDTLGAELELYIVDGDGHPAPGNRQLQRALADPRLTLELNRYNVEYNFEPLALTGDGFRRLENTMSDVLVRLNAVGEPEGTGVLPVGILPTLKESDLGPAMMTDELRYHALSNALRAMRKRPFTIDIDGADPFVMERNDLTAEGVCTSFQIHYCFDMVDFVDTWNAISLVTPVVLGLSANSPLLLGHRLWHETRIPLFKQSIDGRQPRRHRWREPARVEFGSDWLRRDAYELFARMVYLYPPLIPLRSGEDPEEALARGRLPCLDELCLHNGTVWQWNRPIYDPGGNGHIRIEMRSLPAGPTPLDMVANAAFYVGLGVALRGRIGRLIDALPYRYAVANFYRAASEGIEARLIWPNLQQNRLKEQPLRQVAASLLEESRAGLAQLGIDAGDVERLTGVIASRISNGRNGARWQLDALQRLHGNVDTATALDRLLQQYRANVESRRPVADWESCR